MIVISPLLYCDVRLTIFSAPSPDSELLDAGLRFLEDSSPTGGHCALVDVEDVKVVLAADV